MLIKVLENADLKKIFFAAKGDLSPTLIYMFLIYIIEYEGKRSEGLMIMVDF